MFKDAFHYRHGVLHIGTLALTELAESVKTPFYCYCQKTLEDRFDRFATAFRNHDALICFAVKANSNCAVLKTLARRGAGMDVVSEGELYRAMAATTPSNRIVFSGIGKTAAEIAAAIDYGVYQINIESEAELYEVAHIARQKNTTIAVGLRLNPDIRADTHSKITTGMASNKFGIPWQDSTRLYAAAATLDGVEPTALAVHIGSQITDLSPFRRLVSTLTDKYIELRALGYTVSRLDFGGGLGIGYNPDGAAPPSIEDYAELITKALEPLDVRPIIEPGRAIAAHAGALIGRVIYVKPTAEKTFIITDIGMNDLIRPTLYDAYHPITPILEPDPSAPQQCVDIVGPVCESGDYIARNRKTSLWRAGDLMAIRFAGAYGAVQACEYNSRPLIPEVLVNMGQAATIRPRRDYKSMIEDDCIPSWLNAD